MMVEREMFCRSPSACLWEGEESLLFALGLPTAFNGVGEAVAEGETGFL